MDENTETQTSTETSAPAEPSFREAAAEAMSEQTAAPETASRETAQAKPKEDPPFSWDSVDKRARTEYETTQKRLKDTQAYLTKQQQEWKRHEEKLQKFSDYEKSHKSFQYFDQLYNSNQEVQAAINKALGRESNVDPDLQQDPLWKHLQTRDQQLMQQINPIIEWVNQQREETRQRELEAQVDKATEAATSRLKATLGREPTKQEIARIYEYMVERKNYDGESAALAVFFDDIQKAMVQKALDEQMSKKNIGARVSTVNSGKAKNAADSDSRAIRDYIKEGLEELGIQ